MLPETPAHLRQELDFQVAIGRALMATKGYANADVERVYAPSLGAVSACGGA